MKEDAHPVHFHLFVVALGYVNSYENSYQMTAIR